MTKCCALIFLLSAIVPACKSTGPATESETQSLYHSAADYLAGVEDTELKVFASHVPAAVNPQEVPGEIYYKTFSSETNGQPMEVCYLQHGYGIDAKTMKALVHHRFSESGFDIFWKTYFGDSTPRKFLEKTCRQVVIGLQESTETSILEMTKRTELFLKNEICIRSAAAKCAFIGHSKGGAVATTIARRCMEKTSEMGESGCAKLGKVYSSTGVTQGTLLAVLALGAHLDQGNNDSSSVLANIMDSLSFAKVMEKVIGASWNIGAYEPGKSNPMWIDLSPVAPMEDGVPLAIKNNVVLTKTGWLKADYIASGTKFDFTKGGQLSCGYSLGVGHFYHAGLCQAIQTLLPKFHDERLRFLFEKGIDKLRTDPSYKNKQYGNYLDHMSWKQFQVGDGLVNNDSLIGVCQKSLRTTVPNGAAVDCEQYENLNHGGSTGGAPAAITHMMWALQQPVR